MINVVTVVQKMVSDEFVPIAVKFQFLSIILSLLTQMLPGLV